MAVCGDLTIDGANWLLNGKGIVFSSLRRSKRAILRSNLRRTDFEKVGPNYSRVSLRDIESSCKKPQASQWPPEVPAVVQINFKCGCPGEKARANAS
jgi:hypothetical protein